MPRLMFLAVILLLPALSYAQTLGTGPSLLFGLAGRWETTVRVWPNGSDSAAVEAAGGARTRTILDGRFLLWEDSTFIAKQFRQGTGMLAYTAARDSYELTWAESGADALLHLEGNPDSTRTVLTFRGNGAEWTIHVVDGNHLSCLRWQVTDSGRVLQRETIYVREGVRPLMK